MGLRANESDKNPKPIYVTKRIWSDFDIDSDEKAKYHDLHYHQLLKHQ